MDSDRIRRLIADTRGGDAELRESLQRFGWHPRFPALVDENGVVLVGNRRMRIAKELGIAPSVDVVHLGTGEEADAERLKVAIISNIGREEMTAKDRQRIAEHLYGEKGWTIQRIAAALNVGKSTVARDLETFPTAGKVSDRVDRLGRKNTGRRKGKRETPRMDKAREIVRDKVRNDEPIRPRKLAEEHGISHVTIEAAVAAERAVLDEQADPQIDPATLSKTAQEKLAAARRQQDKRMQESFDAEVERRVEELFNHRLTTQINELKATYARVLNVRGKGIMKGEDYRLILSCLHPDSRGSISERKLSEAFGVMQGYRLMLVSEKVEQTPLPTHIPKTRAEWEAARERARVARSAKSKAARRGG